MEHPSISNLSDLKLAFFGCRAGVLVIFAVGFLLAGCSAVAPDQTQDFAVAVNRPDDLIGAVQIYRAAEEDTLADLAITFDLGYGEIVSANPEVDPWLPGAGTTLTLPTAHLLPAGARQGIVINLSEQRLYYFGPDEQVRTFPIGIGRDGLETPIGETTIARKRVGPSWYPTAAARAEDPTLPARVQPGPDNPLGSHALYLGWPTYLIHGTNQPYGIGRRISRGCIRLYPKDIDALYALASVGTPVRVIDQPIKIGWSRNELVIEVYSPAGGGSALPAGVPVLDGRLRARIESVAGAAASRIDWDRVTQAVAQAKGLPVQITQHARRARSFFDFF